MRCKGSFLYIACFCVYKMKYYCVQVAFDIIVNKQTYCMIVGQSINLKTSM